MTNREVIEKILKFHPDLGEKYNGCDDYKCGNPDTQCTGIAVALVPTIDVIRTAKEKGLNLIVVHEPIFYQTPDFPEWKAKYPNEIYEMKKKMVDEFGVTIWRDHDHMHAHRPDCIFTGVEKYMGWEGFRSKAEDIPPFMYVYDIPETTVKKLALELKEKIGISGLRYVGKAEDKIKRVAIVGHLFPNSFVKDGFDGEGYWREYGTDVIELMERGVDAIIPGEVIDWTVLSYVRDAVMLGKTKAVLNIGHFAMEELGMKYAEDYIKELVGMEIPVEYIHSCDMYKYDI